MTSQTTTTTYGEGRYSVPIVRPLVGSAKNHAVQIHLIAVAITAVSNSPIHRFGLSLNTNMSFNTSPLANSSDDLVDK